MTQFPLYVRYEDQRHGLGLEVTMNRRIRVGGRQKLLAIHEHALLLAGARAINFMQDYVSEALYLNSGLIDTRIALRNLGSFARLCKEYLLSKTPRTKGNQGMLPNSVQSRD
jgi:hypothetical protein